VEPAVRRKVLGLVGLGVRARQVVVGVAQVRAAAQRGRLALAIVATDASPNSTAKVVPLLAARRIGVVGGVTASELGAVTGRETTTAIGVVDEHLASGIRAALGGDGMAV
jgi:ribosomal protein L7Ae-like RNA K-turn-binding protein